MLLSILTVLHDAIHFVDFSEQRYISMESMEKHTLLPRVAEEEEEEENKRKMRKERSGKTTHEMNGEFMFNMKIR